MFWKLKSFGFGKEKSLAFFWKKTILEKLSTLEGWLKNQSYYYFFGIVDVNMSSIRPKV
jgi:hypothetical protein